MVAMMQMLALEMVCLVVVVYVSGLSQTGVEQDDNINNASERQLPSWRHCNS